MYEQTGYYLRLLCFTKGFLITSFNTIDGAVFARGRVRGTLSYPVLLNFTADAFSPPLIWSKCSGTE